MNTERERHIESCNRKQALREKGKSQAEHILIHHLQAVSLTHAVSLMPPLVTHGVTHCSVEL